jgi:CubicO group peptidase (beta-lactamase class C family)
VIEGASGEEFLTYMRRHVFDPIGMTHTVADYTDSIIPQRVGFYERNDDRGVVNAPYVDNSYKWAGGGFLSTPSDLVPFGFAHMSGDLLQPETVALLWTPQKTNAGESTDYGIGWFVATVGDVVAVAGHGGGSVGGTAGFELRPPRHVATAILGNLSQAPTGGMIVSLITEAFLEPEDLASTGAGPDITGSFSCVLTAGGEEVVSGTMRIGGAPVQYWGSFTWSNATVDRVIYSSSTAARTRFVTVDAGANLLDLQFTAIGDGELQGTWRSGGTGELACRRQ